MGFWELAGKSSVVGKHWGEFRIYCQLICSLFSYRNFSFALTDLSEVEHCQYGVYIHTF